MMKFSNTLYQATTSSLPKLPIKSLWVTTLFILLLCDPFDALMLVNSGSNLSFIDLSTYAPATPINFNSLWCLSHFSTTLYLTLILSVTLYLLPNMIYSHNSAEGVSFSTYLHLNSKTISKLLYSTLLLLFIVNLT